MTLLFPSYHADQEVDPNSYHTLPCLSTCNVVKSWQNQPQKFFHGLLRIHGTPTRGPENKYRKDNKTISTRG